MNFEVKVNLIYFLKRGTPSTLNNLNQLETTWNDLQRPRNDLKQPETTYNEQETAWNDPQRVSHNPQRPGPTYNEQKNMRNHQKQADFEIVAGQLVLSSNTFST